MEFLPIRAYDNYVQANIQRSMLEQADIICYIKDEYTLTIDPLLNVALGGMKLMVNAGQYSEAGELLDRSDAEYLDTLPCPVCGERAITKRSETIVYANLIDRVKSVLLTGSSQKINSLYECGNCGHQFKQLP